MTSLVHEVARTPDAILHPRDVRNCLHWAAAGPRLLEPSTHITTPRSPLVPLPYQRTGKSEIEIAFRGIPIRAPSSRALQQPSSFSSAMSRRPAIPRTISCSGTSAAMPGDFPSLAVVGRQFHSPGSGSITVISNVTIAGNQDLHDRFKLTISRAKAHRAQEFRD